MPRPSPTAPAEVRGGPGELREVLRQVRADGFATEDGEVTLGLRSVGVAVRDHAGWPVGRDRGDLARTTATGMPRAWQRLLGETASELERRIGRR